MDKLINTLTETQRCFVRACEARGWQPDYAALNPTVPGEIALAAVEDVLGELNRRLENMFKLAESLLRVQPMAPLLISAPPSETPATAPAKPKPNGL